MKITLTSLLMAGMIITIAMIASCSAVEPSWRVKSSQNADVVISDDGSVIVVGGEHITALTRDGKVIWSGWSGSNNDLSGDGKYLITFQGISERFIDNTRGSILWEKGGSRAIVDAVISSNAAMIVSAEEDGTVRFCNNAGIGLGTNRDNKEMPEKIGQLAISSDGEQTIAVAKSGLYSYNKTGNLTWWHDRGGQRVAISDDNTILATIGGNIVSLFHVSGNEKWHDSLFHGDCISFAFSGDGSTIVVGSNDNNIYTIDGNGKGLWNYDTGMWVNGVTVSKDGNKIASGSLNKNIILFDRQGRIIWTYGADGPVKSVGLTKDGQFLVAATDSSIYGFSTAQPVTATQTPTIPQTEVTTQPVTTSPAQTTALPQTPLVTPAETPVPTQKAPVPVFISFIGIFLALFLKK